MTRLVPFFLLPFLLTSTGCLAVAAGAAAGAAASSDNEDVERYILTHDLEPRIAEAMYDGEIVKGMTKEQVGLVLEEADYACEEHEVEKAASKWVCENEDPMHVGQYAVQFREGKVSESEIP